MIMKAMEAGAPMISVPAGVLKEFMTTNNSRTPTPPLSTATVNNNANNSVKNKSRTPTPTPINTPSSTPTPTDTPTDTPNPTPASTPTPTLTPLLSSSLPSSPVVPENSSVTITPSRKLEALLNGKAQNEEKENINSEEDIVNSENKFDDKDVSGTEALINGTSAVGVKRPSTEALINGTSAVGVKRPSTEDPEEPDLKKIRFFPRDMSVTVKEFNQESDLALRKQNHDGSTTQIHQESLSSARMQRDSLVPISRPREKVGLTDKDTLKKRVHRLSRKELESIVMRQFCEKLLYECEMGRMKQLCEKLEATLENNRNKTAQFHKEIEDLRKVTNRLTTEHVARKGQYVAPIKIKRSVGIQAAPHIINKGIMHANGNYSNIKTISPRSSSVVGVMTTTAGFNPGVLPNGTLGIITTTQAGVGRGAVMSGTPDNNLVAPAVRPGQGQIMMMAPSATGVQSVNTVQSVNRQPQPGVGNTMVPVTQGRVVRAPVAAIGTVMAPTGTLLSQRSILLQSDKVATGIPPGAAKSSGIIDLTDEDDGIRGTGRSTMVPKPGTLVKVPTSGTTQLVPIQQAGVGQVVLLNNTSGGQPTALIVSQVSTAMQSIANMSSPAVAQARIGSSVMATSAPDATLETPGAIVTATRTTASTVPQIKVRHPAPLPRTPIQQVAGLSKKLPPQPTLKLSHRESSIVLSWTMAITEDHESIASYQLYAYQEGTTPPSPGLWKKVGSVKALDLPMACTLTQFMPGHVYHFAVRAVDIKSRLGPFSDPRSIKLDKK
ncbi:hypothetical protein Pcinc_033196 [Petrolisthes cinctipes]|uniref:Fibronectin type-III domain-containing protein n=1 Tax=Petrolisthes cinctipes TaxID=88211 RepID=A0AAE1ESV7_PETCI|nr:hypothetical protein Pcinc_033196 [Petrolisthes cinctipes]